MSQQALFGQPDAKDARDTALEAVERTSRASGWFGKALSQLEYMCRARAGTELTGEDIRHSLERCGLGDPHSPNVWGALVRSGIKKGWLNETGRWVPMMDPRSHARKTQVYRLGRG